MFLCIEQKGSRKIAVAFLLLMLIGCTKDRFYYFAKYVDTNCSTKERCELYLSDIYGGDWDIAYYFVNGATLLGVQKQIGAEIDFEFDELCSHLIFLRKNKVSHRDVDCSISNESNLELLLRGKVVYRKAVLRIDRSDEDFLRIPHQESKLVIENQGYDNDGRMVYVVRVQK